jgi:hypothetical protein
MFLQTLEMLDELRRNLESKKLLVVALIESPSAIASRNGLPGKIR